jgi:hypothetical protein
MRTVNDFKIGDRVALHPASDMWMRGAKFGEVVKVGRKLVHVNLDAINRVVRLHPINLKVAN